LTVHIAFMVAASQSDLRVSLSSPDDPEGQRQVWIAIVTVIPLGVVFIIIADTLLWVWSTGSRIDMSQESRVVARKPRNAACYCLILSILHPMTVRLLFTFTA